MQPPPPIGETLGQILREREPNLLRTYLSPHVAGACLALDRYVRETWPALVGPPRNERDFQSFLANSLEEAVSGALKLLRCHRTDPDAATTALILDPADRLAGFASAALADGSIVPFLPGVRTIGGRELAGGGLASLPSDLKFDPIVLVAAGGDQLDPFEGPIRDLIGRHGSKVVTVVDRAEIASLRARPDRLIGQLTPDVVVFDESFSDHAVPFSAFTAGHSLFGAWNRPGKGTFHSTTFQPNTASTRHFLNVLAATDPAFHARHAGELQAVRDDLARRADAYRRHYSPTLLRLIRAAGFEALDVKAEGPSVLVNGRAIYDMVGGVACSIRGHNPPAYLEETEAAADDVRAGVAERLCRLTGLGHVLPAVSGGGAVETALRLALAARSPRRHILALKSGFGGKTLLALTGTANPSYKRDIGPLYPDVHYVDPFAPGAAAQIDALMDTHDFVAVQVELIQSVGGVRAVPDELIRYLDRGRDRHGYLLIVDEIQTGMYRTGPFSRSESLGLTPDLLLLGKGTSDMMFPFALTLMSDPLATELVERAPALVEAIRARFDYEQGYRTVANVLRLGDELDLPRRVGEAAEVFRGALIDALGSNPVVRDVRTFGLLIGLELDASRGLRRWLGKKLAAMYLLAMLRHRRLPVLAGFCQYEPNILKITPPLDADHDDLRRAARTIAEVLAMPVGRVIAAGLGGLLRPTPIRKDHHERRDDAPLELVRR